MPSLTDSAAFALAAATILAVPSRARADDAARCVEAHEIGQLKRNRGELRAARSELEACAKQDCPALVRTDCTQWLPELAREQPTVVVVPLDASGQAVARDGVRVVIDGEARSLGAEALPVDPGTHVLTCNASDGAVAEKRFSVRRSERELAVECRFPEKTSSPTGSTFPIGPVSLMALGVIGLGGAGYFWLDGRSDEDALASGCGRACSPAEIDDVRSTYRLGDIALGVGLVSLAAGAVWLVLAKQPRAPAAAFRY